MSQACTTTHTPLFGDPTFLEQLQAQEGVPLDNQGLWRPLETVLFPQTPVVIKNTLGCLCLIETPAYPSKTPLYTHCNFLSLTTYKEWTQPQLPALFLFLDDIHSCLEKKVPYLWGGNLPEGDPSLMNLLQKNLTPFNEHKRRAYQLQGVDCSGLIYWATRGATARNTSELIREGVEVKIEGFSSNQIAAQMKPGMLIVWTGHVLVCTTQGIVESTPTKGVSRMSTLEKIEELMIDRVPIDAWPTNGNPKTPSFVVRNLYP